MRREEVAERLRGLADELDPPASEWEEVLLCRGHVEELFDLCPRPFEEVRAETLPWESVKCEACGEPGALRVEYLPHASFGPMEARGALPEWWPGD